ncbi:hypothetical protein G7Y89_g3297 [Cudoniella acicularis]|uniref:Uncharacterized protein n=1 Tax=Cudoniella acicularis TaxID=354080 RepID=A0A8H4RTI3_9HELO|nr:hypothetical protein G7Y89_g3297 [Cudoniella acicularis]
MPRMPKPLSLEEQKAWYNQELADLQEFEAPRTHDEPLRLLPPQYLAEMIRSTFKDYNQRAEEFALGCIENYNPDLAISFMKAHRNIMEEFTFTPKGYYSNMAAIISDYVLATLTKRRELDNLPSTPPEPADATMMIRSPPSPRTISKAAKPRAVLSWIHNIDTRTPSPCPPLSPEITDHSSSTNPSQRPRYPRKAKTKSPDYKPQTAQKKTGGSGGVRKNTATKTRKPMTRRANTQSNGRKEVKRGISADDDDDNFKTFLQNSKKRRTLKAP